MRLRNRRPFNVSWISNEERAKLRAKNKRARLSRKRNRK